MKISFFFKNNDILNHWQSQIIQYSIFIMMIKNILTIFCANVEIKRLFNMTKNVINYRWKQLNSYIIEIIMMIKFVAMNKQLYSSHDIDFNSTDEVFANELTTNAQNFLSFVMINDDNNDEYEKNIWNENVNFVFNSNNFELKSKYEKKTSKIIISCL